MFKFGAKVARKLECLGVAGLLSEKCEVYYDHLFSPRHVGRVSDLIAARLGGKALDELRLRTLLLLSVFEAYQSQVNTGETDERKVLLEPITLECGVDEEKVAIGVTFRTGVGLDTDGISDRVSQGVPNGSFERLLMRMHPQADRMLLRVIPGVQVEIVTLLALPDGPIELKEARERHPIQVVILGAESSEQEPPAPGKYIELGDLDYRALLADDEPGKGQPGPSTGEVLAQGCTELEAAIRLRAQAAALEARFKVKGTAESDGSGVVRVRGAGGDLVDGSATVIKGGPPGGSDAADARAYELKIEALLGRVTELEAQLGETEETTEEERPAARIGGLFKKVWPFKKAEDDDAGEVSETEPAPVAAAVEPEAAKSKKGRATKKDAEEDPAFAEPEAEAESTNPEAAANSLIVEIENGSLDRTLNRAQEEAADLKREIQSSRAKRWVDGLMGDLVQEKARLHELARKLNTSIRQKELEFRNKEMALQEELRRRDEMLRQKNNSLSRTKEQLTQATATLDKLKSASQERGDDAHYKQKYALVQKLLATTKDENGRLTGKVDELKAQVTSLQMTVKKQRAIGSAGAVSVAGETAALKSKYERAIRQAEELRSLNEQMRARIQLLNDRADQGGGAVGTGTVNVEATRKRLEAAMKLAAGAQKENAGLRAQAMQLQLKVEELEQERTRLNMELARAQTALKGGGSRGGGKPPAAA